MYAALESLKFVAIVLALVSGLIGALTDVRTEDKKKITGGGWATIVCIVLAAVIGLSSELIDIAKQRRDEVEARQRLSDDLQRQSTMLAQQAQALEQIDRTLNPLDDFVVTCEFSIPLDQDKVREYGQRVVRGWPNMGGGLDVNLVPQLWPAALNEGSVLTAVKPTNVVVKVSRPGAKPGLKNEDLILNFPGEFPAVQSAWPTWRPPQPSSAVFLVYSKTHGSLEVTLVGATCRFDQSTSTISSLRDFAGGTIEVTLNPAQAPTIQRRLTSFTLQTRKGRSLHVTAFSGNDSWFRATLPEQPWK